MLTQTSAIAHWGVLWALLGVAALGRILVDLTAFEPALFARAAIFCSLPVGLLLWVRARYNRRLRQEKQHVRDLSDLHLSTVEALARAIDAKDQQSHFHLRRIQVFSAELARVAGMSEFETHGVRTAALLHDVGQLAVPEHILAKPGPLTDEEREKMRTHPEVGAAILASVPFPYPVAPFILCHHERWDGQGYPAGLAGEQIPLGARILSVVDYYDALTSDRPYHRAMPHALAVELLEEEAGRALDPTLVRQFLTILPGLRAELADVAPGAAPSPPGAGTRTVFDDIALAHREIYTLYEIAHSMGTSLSLSDTMELVSSKLARLVPYSCCALFLRDEAETLRCRYAQGLDADVVHRLASGNGGAAGLVARSGETLVNMSPRVDLDASGQPSVVTRLQASLLVPLHHHDSSIGCLALYDLQPHRYTENHRRLLLRVAEQAGAVIHNSLLFERTRQDSLTDALTGLPNVRFLYMHVARELARATRLGTPVALVVLDLDDFKRINDRCGHHAGDLALKDVGRCLREAIRPYDLCARYAGDEFILVLTGCDGEEAAAKLVELQAAIENLPVPDPAVQMGISGGVAVFPHDGRTYESLLVLADNRMYRDKAGRKDETITVSRRPAKFAPPAGVTCPTEAPARIA